MARRPKLAAAVERDEAKQKPAPSRRRGRGAAPKQAAEEPKRKLVGAYFPPEVKRSLRMVQAQRGGQLQDIIGEALNLLFAKYNVPESAPVKEPRE